MSIFLNLLSAALYVMLFQNLIFNSGYGLSEAVRMSAKPRQLFPMAIFITFFSTVTSAICVLFDLYPVIRNLSEIPHALIYVGVLLVIYIFTMICVLPNASRLPCALHNRQWYAEAHGQWYSVLPGQIHCPPAAPRQY